MSGCMLCGIVDGCGVSGRTSSDSAMSIGAPRREPAALVGHGGGAWRHQGAMMHGERGRSWLLAARASAPPGEFNRTNGQGGSKRRHRRPPVERAEEWSGRRRTRCPAHSLYSAARRFHCGSTVARWGLGRGSGGSSARRAAAARTEEGRARRGAWVWIIRGTAAMRAWRTIKGRSASLSSAPAWYAIQM